MERDFWKKRKLLLSVLWLFFLCVKSAYGEIAAEVFMTSGDSSETTTLLSDGRLKEIIVTPEMILKNSKYSLVVLLCNASYPIEWIYKGQGAPRIYTTQIRSFGDFFDQKTYNHTNVVVLYPERFNEQQTGTYVCQGVEEPKETIEFHIYFPGEFGFPSLQHHIVAAKQDDSSVIIPCPTTNPQASIGLFKFDPQFAAQNLTNDARVRYDPKVGFTLKLADFLSPHGTYYCKYKDSDDLWKIDIVLPKEEEVKVFPNEDVVLMSNFVNHSFTCNAKEDIRLALPNSPTLGPIEYYQNYSDPFNFVAKLIIPSFIPIINVVNYFKIHCMTAHTRRILHTWEFSSFGPEEIQISYDSSQQRLLCCSKSGLTPIHELAKCETVTDCKIKQHCFRSGRCEYSFPPRFVDAPRGCTAVQFSADFPSHAMRCSVGPDSKTQFLTSNVANSDLIIHSEEVVPATEDILQITPLKQDKKNRVNIRCIGSLFYFSTNFVFAFEKLDGSIQIANESTIENPTTYSPVLQAIIEPDTSRVYCFAPLTRSNEWRNVSIPIISVATDSVIPLTAPARYVF